MGGGLAVHGDPEWAADDASLITLPRAVRRVRFVESGAALVVMRGTS